MRRRRKRKGLSAVQYRLRPEEGASEVFGQRVRLQRASARGKARTGEDITLPSVGFLEPVRPATPACLA